MKNQIILGVILSGSAVLANAQVGINTPTPAGTLDVVAKTTGIATTTPEGLIAPRLTISDLSAKTPAYGTAQTGTLIYVTNATNAEPSGQTVNITAAGYHFFDGTVWQKVTTGNGGSNIYTSDGTLLANRTVTMADKTLAFNSAATTGTSHFSIDGSTLSVDAVNNRVGLGTTAPVQKLHVSNGDVLINNSATPRLIFQSNTPQVPNQSNNNGSILFLEGENSLANGTYISHINSTPGFPGDLGNLLQFGAIEGGSFNPVMNIQSPLKYVGISDTTPNSTLDVQGSFATSYSENNATNYTIGATDHTITATNTGGAAPIWTLPVFATGTQNFIGREYVIRNASGSTMTLKGNGSELIDVAGAGTNTVSIPTGYAAFVKSTGGTSATGVTWVLTMLASSSVLKTLQYNKKIITPVDGNTPNITMDTGNLRVRYNGTNSGTGFVEFHPIVNNHVSVLYHKSGGGGTNIETYGAGALNNTTWYRMPGTASDSNLCVGCRDIANVYIILHNSKEIYRVTINANGDIPASGGVAAVASSITFFVEKLD